MMRCVQKSNASGSPVISSAQIPARQPVSHGIRRGEFDEGEGDTFIWFRQFRAVPHARLLLVDGRPVELGSRAFDLLILLIEASGELVTKDEIMDRIWPATTVDESNLRVQMAALRKVLGKDRDIIKTIPGRGYVFAEEVKRGPMISLHERAFPFPNHMPASDLPNRRILDRVGPIAAHHENQPTIAVIDDDPDIRESLHGLLRSVGWRVEVYGSVEELLINYQSVHPGCLVLDVWLPGRSGLDFHAELARSNVRLPVILMSGHADVPMSVQAMKSGAVEFLTKPVRYQDLLNAIESALGSQMTARC
jgi:DNA-binding response OmpR family regulator